MAKTATLSATPRDGSGKGAARQLRRQGRVPAVIYGHGEETRSLSLDAHEVSVLFSHISVESTVIDLSIEGAKGGPVKALVREVQAHPYRDELLHVDFYQLHAGEKVEVEVPLRLVGTAPGVKEGGVMNQAMHVLPISCLPDAIPEHIEVDVSGLDINESIHVSELTIPDGIEVELDGDRTVCTVSPPTVIKTEDEEGAEAAVELESVDREGEPELIRKREAEAGEESEEE